MKNISLFIYSFTVVYLLIFSGVVAAEKPKTAEIPIKNCCPMFTTLFNNVFYQ